MTETGGRDGDEEGNADVDADVHWTKRRESCKVCRSTIQRAFHG